MKKDEEGLSEIVTEKRRRCSLEKSDDMFVAEISNKVNSEKILPNSHSKINLDSLDDEDKQSGHSFQKQGVATRHNIFRALRKAYSPKEYIDKIKNHSLIDKFPKQKCDNRKFNETIKSDSKIQSPRENNLVQSGMTEYRKMTLDKTLKKKAKPTYKQIKEKDIVQLYKENMRVTHYKFEKLTHKHHLTIFSDKAISKQYYKDTISDNTTTSYLNLKMFVDKKEQTDYLNKFDSLEIWLKNSTELSEKLCKGKFNNEFEVKGIINKHSLSYMGYYLV